ASASSLAERPARGTVFVADTHVTPAPTPEQLAEMTVRAADAVKLFGLKAKAALLSHSNFGSTDSPASARARAALERIQAAAPYLEVDGEMTAEAAISAEIRRNAILEPRYDGSANLLIMPNLDAAHIAYGLLKEFAGAQKIGPVLLGLAKPAHILDNSSTVRGIVNMAAYCVVDAQEQPRHSR
ncbi:MAG: phosphate acyltransferase, partial [Tagaea sp.]